MLNVQFIDYMQTVVYPLPITVNPIIQVISISTTNIIFLQS